MIVIIQNYPYNDYTKYQNEFWHFHALRVMKGDTFVSALQGNEHHRCKKHKNDYSDMEIIKRIE